MSYHYVWMFWSSAFLLPWLVLWLLAPSVRSLMWRASLVTALFGLTEPLFVPEYWNPPSLFDLARKTGFDIESLIFCFALGGVGAALYNVLTRRAPTRLPRIVQSHRRHRWHRITLTVPVVVFIGFYFLSWNPIYPAILAMVAGAAAAMACRPDLVAKTLLGGVIFFGYYALFMLALLVFAPGYIAQVWNLSALSGVQVVGIPLEELLFGLAFGMYWTGAYEHLTWHTTSSAPREFRGTRAATNN